MKSLSALNAVYRCWIYSKTQTDLFNEMAFDLAYETFKIVSLIVGMFWAWYCHLQPNAKSSWFSLNQPCLFYGKEVFFSSIIILNFGTKMSMSEKSASKGLPRWPQLRGRQFKQAKVEWGLGVFENLESSEVNVCAEEERPLNILKKYFLRAALLWFHWIFFFFFLIIWNDSILDGNFLI